MKTLTDIRGYRNRNIPLQEKTERSHFNAPSTLLLQRKYIRQLPGNLSVCVYYSSQLKKMITIPIDDVKLESLSEGPPINQGSNEMDNLSMIQQIVATETDDELEFNDGTRIPVNVDLANNILACYARLTKENKIKFDEALNCGSKSFIKMAKFCQKNQKS